MKNISDNDMWDDSELEGWDDEDGVELCDEDDEYDRPAKKIHHLEHPRKIRMNSDTRDDFVAIDFETMTALHTSACAVGMVKVIDGEIVQQFYSIINPVRDEYTDKEPNRRIHGISLETAQKANTFAELFEEIRRFIGRYPLVCHNKGADMSILKQTMEYYSLTGIDTSNAICTYQLTGLSLSKCCKELGITLSNHHNALSDAEACARIYLELIGKPLINQGGCVSKGKETYSNREISKEHRQKLDDNQVTNRDTLFYNASVVITGTFEKFPERDALAAKIQSLGARITSSISKKTTHVVVGDNAGPKKIDKIHQLQEEGVEIAIIRPHELEKILD